MHTINQRFPTKIDVSLIFFILFYIFTLRGVSSEQNLVFALTLMWVFLIFVTDFKIIQTIITNKLIICLGMYLFYTFIVSLITEGLITSIGYSLGQLSLFIGIIMFLYYRQKYSFETFKKLVYVLLAIWIYYCWKAIIFYNKNEFAARDIISHQGEQYGNVAIGEGYGLAFGSALLGVSISYLLFQSISKPKKIIIIFIVLTSIFLCFQTGSTITLIALLIGLVINIFIFFVRTLVNKGRSKYLLISIMSGISLIIFSIILSTNRIGNYLIDISGNFNKLYQSRLILLGNMLTGEGSGGTLTARINLYMQSISTFLDNFWIGTIEISGLMTNYLIGGHSELFDSFAKLGIIGASIYISIFVINLFMYRPIKNIFMYTGYIITFFILLTFNPFHYPQSNFVYFFICSSLFHISKNRVHSNQINDNNLKEFQRKNS